MEAQKIQGTPYKKMKPDQKMKFILKLVVCIFTFGMVFPNVMGE